MTSILLWVDIETTGLDFVNDDILEVAYVATTMRGDILPHVAHVYVNGDVSKIQNDYVLQMHLDNGLLADHPDQYQYTHQSVAKMIDNFAEDVKTEGYEQVFLAGASVHFDRTFLETRGEHTFKHLSHRHVDISTMKLSLGAIGKSLGQKIVPRHRAWWDVIDEIEQYKQLLKLMK